MRAVGHEMMPDISLLLTFHLSIIKISESSFKIMKMNEYFLVQNGKSFWKNGPKVCVWVGGGLGLKGNPGHVFVYL